MLSVQVFSEFNKLNFLGGGGFVYIDWFVKFLVRWGGFFKRNFELIYLFMVEDVFIGVNGWNYVNVLCVY